MSSQVKNLIEKDSQLYKEYNWYSTVFPELLQLASDEFFEPNFHLYLIGVSKNINYLLDDETSFVTRIRLNKDYEIFFRLTAKAVKLILDKSLGQSKNKFNISKISSLEAKVITTFNDYLFNKVKTALLPPPQNELKRNNFDVIHLTFIIREREEYNTSAGKIVVTLPAELVKPEIVTSTGDKYSNTSFPNTETFAKAVIGKTKFSLYDLKHIEEDDVVIFEDSNLETIKLIINEQSLSVRLNPNMDILIPEEDDGELEMDNSNNKNIWDNIEVEMCAEFDSVKISLGELKKVEDGLVVDLTSLYDNNVTLKVEGNPIASGSLVIINDRYGVKINKVLTGGSTPAQTNEIPQQDIQVQQEEVMPQEEYQTEQAVGSEEEEFDYSDFEIEDENI